MNKNIILFIAAAGLTLLAGCAKESAGGGTDLPMQVAPTLAGDTKGSLTTSDLTDFYLQIVSDDVAYSYFEHASKDGSGAWTTPSKLFWKNETSPVSYCAARFGAFAFTADDFKNGVLLEVPADQRMQEQLNAADLLTMPAASKKYEDTTGGILPVALAHGLAKVSFTLTLGPKFYDNLYTRGANPVKDFTVKGTGTGFNFQPQTGAVSVKSDPQANILPFASAFTPATAEAKSATAVFEAILVPQALPAGALKVTFKVGAYGYEWSNATAITLEAGKTYNLAVSVTDAPPGPFINGHEYVDLGLPSGLKWATCNVGATAPEEPGDHFAWGETVQKTVAYTWSTLKYCLDDNGSIFSKYVSSSMDGFWGGAGSPDNKMVLDAEDDAATANWGAPWRTPTDAEWTELRNNCDFKWTTQNGVKGYLFTSKKNQATLFLPAAGGRIGADLKNDGSEGCYWSSSLVESAPYRAGNVYFDSGGVYKSSGDRYTGQSVRPVCN